MKIDNSAKLIYGPRTPGAVINGVTLDTTDGVAHSGHGFACVGYEAGAAPLTGEAKRKGGSRVYFRLQANRGDIKVIPVTGDSGELPGTPGRLSESSSPRQAMTPASPSPPPSLKS